jgi:hypothetical protein
MAGTTGQMVADGPTGIGVTSPQKLITVIPSLPIIIIGSSSSSSSSII